MLQQQQLVLPVIDVIQEAGGRARTAEIYDRVAERLATPQAVREARVPIGDKRQTCNAFERSVRWAQQRAKLQGLMEPLHDGLWRLTGKGRKALHEAAPGVVVTVFTTDKGAALYAHCEDAVGHLEDGSVSLVMTSPPYPLLNEKSYGNRDAARYVDWLLRIAQDWPRKLTADGSIVLNLADAWERGQPSLSLYQERLLLRLVDELGLHLCQRLAWQNPSKMPAPAEWVTVRRVRVKPALEQVYWLSPTPHPYADNRGVLKAYSAAMQARLAAGGERAAERPSGYALAQGAFGTDNGGAIPDNLLVAANTESNSGYIRGCKAAGLPVHPARFPGALPEFFIRLLTREDDLVYDPFGGSLKTAEVAERLGRRWVSSEMMLEFLQGAAFRFPQAQGPLARAA